MKKLTVVLVLLFSAAAVYAQKQAAKAKPVKSADKKEQKVRPEKQPQEQQPAGELDLNTKAWLHSIRMKVYGFDPNNPSGKKGC